MNLKIQEVDSGRGFLLVKQAKGKKDRIVPLSDKILALLREYYSYEKPVLHLLEGQKPDYLYSEKILRAY